MTNRYLLFVVLALAFVAGCTVTGNTVSKSQDQESVSIPLSELSDQVKFFSYDDNGVEINYFAVLGSDGKARTAFDACDVCGGKKGYEQKGDDIFCRNCGRHFSIDGLGAQNRGYGCWPSYLPHKIVGNDIVIDVDDIKSGRSRFI